MFPAPVCPGKQLNEEVLLPWIVRQQLRFQVLESTTPIDVMRSQAFEASNMIPTNGVKTLPWLL